MERPYQVQQRGQMKGSLLVYMLNPLPLLTIECSEMCRSLTSCHSSLPSSKELCKVEIPLLKTKIEIQFSYWNYEKEYQNVMTLLNTVEDLHCTPLKRWCAVVKNTIVLIIIDRQIDRQCVNSFYSADIMVTPKKALKCPYRINPVMCYVYVGCWHGVCDAIKANFTFEFICHRFCYFTTIYASLEYSYS